MPTLRSHTHLQAAQIQAQSKAFKRVCLPKHTADRNNAAKMKDRITKDKNGQLVTACIVHLADSDDFKDTAFNKLCSGLTDLCFESPNDTIHANRWQQGVEKTKITHRKRVTNFADTHANTKFATHLL